MNQGHSRPLATLFLISVIACCSHRNPNPIPSVRPRTPVPQSICRFHAIQMASKHDGQLDEGNHRALSQEETKKLDQWSRSGRTVYFNERELSTSPTDDSTSGFKHKFEAKELKTLLQSQKPIYIYRAEEQNPGMPGRTRRTLVLSTEALESIKNRDMVPHGLRTKPNCTPDEVHSGYSTTRQGVLVDIHASIDNDTAGNVYLEHTNGGP